MAFTEPIRDRKQLQTLAGYFLKRGQLRNHVLIVMGACTALRISDLLDLKWSDVYDEKQQAFRRHIVLTEKKTGKQKAVALHRQAVLALLRYFPHRRGDYIFVSNRRDERPISRVQAWRIVHRAAAAVNLSDKVACHSLRKTWGYHAWTSNAVSPVVIMDVYNHSSYDVTRRYLGIVQDDLDNAYLSVELF